MEDFPGYTVLKRIFGNAETLVFCVEKDNTGEQFILKTTASNHPSLKQKARYLHEYETLKILKLSGAKYVVRVKETGIHKHRPFLILEDSLAGDLNHIKISSGKNNNFFDIETLLDIGIKISCGLGELYKAHIIHKDIKPGNILYNPETGILKFVDFSSASTISMEEPYLPDSGITAATLAYMSPEQTGRMNRILDWRTDFYSFGVTLYELATGILPFQFDDPMEMVHAHMAIIPKTPHKINGKIPLILSRIIMKLMEKNADKRYQSAFGINYDLKQCLSSIRKTSQNRVDSSGIAVSGSEFESALPQGILYKTRDKSPNQALDQALDSFELGQKDISDRPIIPQKLYGRDKEIEILRAGFKAVCRGANKMLLVKGEPGIGKSAIVNEVQRYMVQKKGYFISGKFDELKQIPYGALIQAFGELVSRILCQDDHRISAWKRKLAKSLGTNGQLIIDIIPHLELITGRQRPVPELGARESENRFISVFENFIKAFISINHPIVLFLDDLQWADPASLNMIKKIMALKTGYLYIIGAFRDNETEINDSFMMTVEEIKDNGTKVEIIELARLTKKDISLLIAETFLCSKEESEPLSDLCLEKTRGNPFFLNQFILSLFDKKFICLNEEYGKWEWDYNKIKLSDITDNAADLMINKIQAMSFKAQKILQYAACIGNCFDLHTLSVVYGQSFKETSADLFEVLLQGLILPLDESYKYISGIVPSDVKEDNGFSADKSNALAMVVNPVSSGSFIGTVKYKFLHDRVQEAAYSLIKDKEKQKIHLKAGNELLKNTKKNDLEDHIFDIVDHLNFACELIKEPQERQNLAELNLSAGKKAKKSAAFDHARDYFTAGIKILEENCWETQYNLSLHLHEQAAETAFLMRKFLDMEDEIKEVLDHAGTILDLVEIYKIKIQACTSQHKLTQAVDTGFSILKKIGIGFPENPGRLQILLGYLRIKLILAGKLGMNLIDMPAMTDPAAFAALDIMQTMGFSVYVASPEKAPFFIFKGIYLSLKYGNTEFSSVFYAHYAIFLCGMVQHLKTGYQFGLTSLQLLDKFNAAGSAAKTEVIFNFFIRHWMEPLKSTLKPLKNAYKKGFQTGDFEFAAAAASQYPYFSYFAGIELPKVAQRALKYNKIIKGLNQKSWQNYNERTFQTALNLMGQNEDPTLLSGEVFNEKIMFDHYTKENDRTGICSLYINKMILCYLFYDYDKALENAVCAAQHIIALTSHVTVPVFNFYESLTYTAVFLKSSNHEKKTILEKLSFNQKKMKKWAYHCPSNYLHKWCLVEAQRLYISGKNNGKASELYNKAIAEAEKNNYIQEEALANELAAVFYLQTKNMDKAKHHMAEARYCYETWGAYAKVHHIETNYSILSSETLLSNHPLSKNSLSKPPLSKEISMRGKKADLHVHQGGKADFYTHPAGAGFLGEFTHATVSSSTFTENEQLDLNSVIKASQIISGEIHIDKLIASMLEIIVANAGAEKGFLILKSGGKMTIEAGYRTDYRAHGDNCITVNAIGLEEFSDIPRSIINYTMRTKKTLVLDDASNQGGFTEDPYIIKNRLKSVLCAPLIYQGKLNGIIYLENNIVSKAFTEDRLEVIFLLCTQAAISLENARLYQTLEDYTSILEKKVEERTAELKKSIETIKLAQDQLIQSEKLAALGSLVAGVAHEINTPVGVSMTSASFLKDKTDDFIYKLKAKTLTRSNVNKYTEIARKSSDLIMKNLIRAVKIIHGFKRVAVDQTSCECRKFNLKSCINDILTSLEPEIKKIKPEIIINCPEKLDIVSFPGAFFQIITNLIMNSLIHGFDLREKGNKILFDVQSDNDTIIFLYKDNGRGMDKETQKKIFEPFFTTNRLKGGSGLGMHIVYNLVTQTLGGSISCESMEKQGVRFTITMPLKK